MSWQDILLERLERQGRETSRFAQLLADYDSAVSRLQEVEAHAQQLSKENKLLRFELVNFDTEKLHALEDENQHLKQRLHDHRSHSVPALMAPRHSTHDTLSRELHAANEQNARLKQLLREERAANRAAGGK